MASETALAFFARRLSSRSTLSDADITAIHALPFKERYLNPNAYLVREGEPPRPYCSLVLSGFAFRHKFTVHGTRQIVSIHLSGDLLDLQHLFLNIADHSIQALSELHVVDLDREALQELVLTRPAVGRAVWVDGLVDASVYREWVLNVGRRDARARIAHILCEMAVRLRAAGLTETADFHLPMTQEQLGDATGLTSVHVNRTIKTLANDGLIQHGGRWLSISDWDGLRKVGNFNPLYLHLDQTGPEIPTALGSMFAQMP